MFENFRWNFRDRLVFRLRKKHSPPSVCKMILPDAVGRGNSTYNSSGYPTVVKSTPNIGLMAACWATCTNYTAPCRLPISFCLARFTNAVGESVKSRNVR